jgi:hypothetical protein
MMKSTLLLMGFLLVYGCGPPPNGHQSPFPDLEVAGQVIDVRGGGIEGVAVRLSNQYDAAVTFTDALGGFNLTIDGAEEPTSISLSHPQYRPWSGSLLVDNQHQSAGVLSLVSAEEILFSTWEGELYMLRADGAGGLLQLTSTPAEIEVTPSRSASGHTIRWANTSTKEVYESSWSGGGARSVYQLQEGYQLLGISWGARGTFVSRLRQEDGVADITIAEDPSGGTFSYDWPGQFPDESPPVFGNIGPQPIAGNMLVFAGAVEDYQGSGETRYGLFTAFPYFGNELLIPEHINGTLANDLYPRWSPYREDGSLDLALVRDYQIFVSHVTSDEENNYYSLPARIYGGASNDINVSRIAWAPDEAGSVVRLAFSVNAFSSGSTLAERGDIVLLRYDHTTGALVGEPEVIYDASEGVGLAISVDWR